MCLGGRAWLVVPQSVCCWRLALSWSPHLVAPPIRVFHRGIHLAACVGTTGSSRSGRGLREGACAVHASGPPTPVLTLSPAPKVTACPRELPPSSSPPALAQLHTLLEMRTMHWLNQHISRHLQLLGPGQVPFAYPRELTATRRPVSFPDLLRPAPAHCPCCWCHLGRPRGQMSTLMWAAPFPPAAPGVPGQKGDERGGSPLGGVGTGHLWMWDKDGGWQYMWTDEVQAGGLRGPTGQGRNGPGLAGRRVHSDHRG